MEIKLNVEIQLSTKNFSNNIEDYLHVTEINNLENCCELLYLLKTQFKDEIIVDKLYDLAIIVKRNFPKNKINWINTFLVIESLNYLNALEGETEDESEIDVFDNISEALNFSNEQESRTLINEDFKKVILQKLYEKNIT